MLSKKNNQLTMWDMEIFKKLIPSDHLLVKIDNMIDFNFVYEIVNGNYKTGVKGRKSYDPVILFKLCLLEYIYCLSDVKVIERARTDVAFRWFLWLSLEDNLPDDSTISYFRIHRLGAKNIESVFNEIIRICISNEIIKNNRYIVDSTDVEANTNYPSDIKLVINSFRNLLKEIKKSNPALAFRVSIEFEEELAGKSEEDKKLTLKEIVETAKKYQENIYEFIAEELSQRRRLRDLYMTFFKILNQHGKKSDKIVSYVDPDARVAHKSPGKIKKGYKNHIIIDEDSEIILSSTVTPFNVGDQKELVPLVENVAEKFNMKPKELSADKVYGTVKNRMFLDKNEIVANIAFYNRYSRKNGKFGLDKFEISKDMDYVKCPNGQTSRNKYFSKRENGPNKTVFKFTKEQCQNCPLKQDCLRSNEKTYFRKVEIPVSYDVFKKDRIRNVTLEFQQAYNKRYKVERRFATLVRNHSARRSRYLRIEGAKIHIFLANIACNIIRMVNLKNAIHHPEVFAV